MTDFRQPDLVENAIVIALHLIEDAPGSNAARVWKVIWELFPDECQKAVDAVDPTMVVRGAGWQHLWYLIDAIESLTQSLLDENSGNHANAPMHAPDQLTRLSVFGDVLHKLIEGSEQSVRVRAAKPRPAVVLDGCTLCWRFGAAHRDHGYYCDAHVPTADNSEYKRANGLMQWCNRAGRLAFQSNYVALREKLPTGLHTDDPVFSALSAVVRGVAVGDVPHVDIPFEAYWPALPNLAMHLRTGEVDTSDLTHVIAYLDPLNGTHKDRHQRIHSLFLVDQRLLLNMAIFAEAFLATGAERRKARGGPRRTHAKVATPEG